MASTTITKTGPIFAPNVTQEVKSAVRHGLFDIAVEITGDTIDCVSVRKVRAISNR